MFGRIKVSGQILKKIFMFPEDTEVEDQDFIVFHPDIPVGNDWFVDCYPTYRANENGDAVFIGWNPAKNVTDDSGL